MFDPMAVNSPLDLPAQSPAVVESRGRLTLRASRPLFYNFHWLREVALGAIEGDLGLRIDAGGAVSTSLTVNACHRQEISLDEAGRLRLRILKHRSRDFNLAAQVGATVHASTPLPRQPDALVAAVLGVHPSQLMKDGALPDAARQLSQLWNATASPLAAFQALHGRIRQQVEALFGPVRSNEDAGRLLGGLKTLVGLRDSVYQEAVAAVEKKHGAELSWRYDSAGLDTALVDCSFAFTEQGLCAYRRALQGDYSWILDADQAHVSFRKGVLTSGLRRETTVELHLPFLDRKEWRTRLESLAKMEVAGDGGGRVLVYCVDASHRVTSRNAYQSVLALAGGLSVGRVHTRSSFTLSYTDQRRLPCGRAAQSLAAALEGYGFAPEARQSLESLAAGRAGELDVSLALSIPGSLVEAWLAAPGERDPDFFEAYSRVSVAVQRAIRVWLPYIYFSDVSRYNTLEAAFPLIIYQVSRPFQGKPKYDFTYDALDERTMSGFFRMAGQQLPAELARVEQLLLRSGLAGTAAFYSTRRARNILESVQSRPRLLKSLLVADAFLVDALVNLGCRGRRLRQDAAGDPAQAVRDLSRFAADLVKAFHGKLRRLYGGQEFLALGGLLLVEATAALGAAEDKAPAVRAAVRLSQGPPGSPAAFSHTLVNPAYLPE